MEVDNKRGDLTNKRLEDQDGGVHLVDKERSFKSVSNNNAGNYLQGIKKYGLSATEKQERRCNWELEKLASQTRSVVEMFSAHCDKKKSYDKDVTPNATSVFLLSKTLKEKRL